MINQVKIQMNRYFSICLLALTLVGCGDRKDSLDRPIETSIDSYGNVEINSYPLGGMAVVDIGRIRLLFTNIEATGSIFTGGNFRLPVQLEQGTVVSKDLAGPITLSIWAAENGWVFSVNSCHFSVQGNMIKIDGHKYWLDDTDDLLIVLEECKVQSVRQLKSHT